MHINHEMLISVLSGLTLGDLLPAPITLQPPIPL